jgi:hypothetical protein
MSITAKGITAKKFADIDPADMDISHYGHKPFWTLMFMSINAKRITTV